MKYLFGIILASIFFMLELLWELSLEKAKQAFKDVKDGYYN